MSSPFASIGIGMEREVSVLAVVLGVLMVGLTWFISNTWSNFFTAWVTEIAEDIERIEDHQKLVNKRRTYHSLIIAVISTLFVITVVWLMITLYRKHTEI